MSKSILIPILLIGCTLSVIHAAKFRKWSCADEIYSWKIVSCENSSPLKAADVPKCPTGDAQCIQQSTTKILRDYANGLASINLLPLDPISIDKIDIASGNSGPVNLKLYFKNAKLYGAKDAIIKSVR